MLSLGETINTLEATENHLREQNRKIVRMREIQYGEIIGKPTIIGPLVTGGM